MQKGIGADVVAIAGRVGPKTTSRVKTTTRFSDFDSASDDEKRQRGRRWSFVVEDIGERYAECRVGNFDQHGTEDEKIAQCRAITEIKQYGESVVENVAAGVNVVMFGPPGTGKDHLLTALMWQACKFGFSVTWRNGVDLFAECRDAIDSAESERSLLSKFVAPDILAISDPVPPWGELSQFQASFLFRVLDKRYRMLKPVWITGNFRDGEDAKARLGAQVRDRLRHGGVAVNCNWQSFRKRS